MRVVALISGGKDSTFNMMQCQAEGHQIVALANLHPKDKDELDSYMYQTVGHQGIEKLAEAMELPLYRRETLGKSLSTGKFYEPTAFDEVEDLYELLKQTKDELQVEAVSVGAIFSDYQRVRVENVCSRLNLVSLAFLWRREQAELMQEMIDCNVTAIIIKVASLGLTPDRHLGKTIKDMQPHLVKMKEKYGLNICGEGGEYETFTLDCPLFKKKKIVIDEQQIVISSSDPVCEVGYINFLKLRLVPKDPPPAELPIRTSIDFITDLNESSYCDLSDPDLSETELEFIEKENNAKLLQGLSKDPVSRSNSINIPRPKPDITKMNSVDESIAPQSPVKIEYESIQLNIQPQCVANSKGWHWICGIQGIGENKLDAFTSAMVDLEEIVVKNSLYLTNILYITLYVRSMADYIILNEVYKEKLNFQNPPTRVCVECPLPENCHLMLDAVAFKAPTEAGEIEHKRHTLHVQGMSHWAPANIGPYSQSTRIGDITYISGQIALIPGNMTVIEGGIKQECKLTLRHVTRIAKAMNSHGQLRDVVQGICFVTHPNFITEARRQWERRSANALMDFIVVPNLPRKALIEWQVWTHAHNDKFDYEETGCSVADYTISIRRRWNIDNNCAAIVCYVSTGQTTSTTKLTDLNDDVKQRHQHLSQSITKPQLIEIFKYSLSKILKGYPSPPAPEQPAIHFRVFYQVGASPGPDNLIQALTDFREGAQEIARVGYSVIPAVNLQNFSTFISICGIRH